ncbi:anti-sigma factor [Brevibacillus choshinensis]|uniref:Anti-sigma factor n=1 Tax=Brevibacillus choshinensis TaxID=54911 RepID=A0ABX7FL67_BRECH|nr:anti-sigma factor [Brevibacillus choshinensis]QRG66994.1 anti-sigma factor [Brevibacillus choshinensis]
MTNQSDDSREQKLLAYLRGELDEREAQKIRDEIADDEEYASRLERLLLGESDGEALLQQAETLTEKQQRSIIRRGKWKMRLTNSAYTFGIFFVLGVAATIANGWIGSWMYDDLFRVTRDMVNFTQPGVSAGSSGSQVGGLYGQIKMELREQVGAEQQNIGFFENTNILWSIHAEPKWANGIRETKLFFRYPTDEKMTEEETAYLRTPAWNAMNKLPEGTVSQLAISFDHPITYEEYNKRISQHVFSHNADTVWFAVDTGVELDESEHESGNLLLSAGDVWGFSERVLDYGDSPIRVNGEGDRRAAAFLAEMKYLTEHDRLTRSIGTNLVAHQDPKIAQRYAYLQEKGVLIYGAVLTGPTKELLKLQAEKSITAAFLGKVNWWNWDRPGASGTQIIW